MIHHVIVFFRMDINRHCRSFITHQDVNNVLFFILSSSFFTHCTYFLYFIYYLLFMQYCSRLLDAEKEFQGRVIFMNHNRIQTVTIYVCRFGLIRFFFQILNLDKKIYNDSGMILKRSRIQIFFKQYFRGFHCNFCSAY